MQLPEQRHTGGLWQVEGVQIVHLHFHIDSNNSQQFVEWPFCRTVFSLKNIDTRTSQEWRAKASTSSQNSVRWLKHWILLNPPYCFLVWVHGDFHKANWTVNPLAKCIWACVVVRFDFAAKNSNRQKVKTGHTF